MMTGFDFERVREALAVLADQGRGDVRTVMLVGDYSSPNVSEKVARVILSYTDYVNRRTWFKG
jgi:UDP-N-acetylglucosamine 2-epimerase (non-hydrolysing)